MDGLLAIALLLYGFGVIIYAIVGGIFGFPALGFVHGWCANYFFEKANSSTRHSLIQKIIGVLIVTWPLVAVGVVSAVNYPEQQRRKEAKIVKREKRAAQWAEDKQKYEEKKRAEIELYEEKQRDSVYRFNLAGYDIDLKAFKYLRVSFNSKTPYDRGLRLWGNALEDYENTNGKIDNNDIYRVYVQTNIIKDVCPNTDLELALIWCREHVVANAINYRPYEVGRLVFERDLKKTQLDLFLSYAKTDLSEKSSGLDPIPFNEEQIWRINKTPEFENIYSDIYLACTKLSENEKRIDFAKSCKIGFRLNEEIFVNMSMPINSKSMFESDSLSAVRQSLKYWDLISN